MIPAGTSVIFVFSLLLLAWGVASAQTATASPPVLSVAQARTVTVHIVRPNYPTDAQGRHPTGTGVVLILVDRRTGSVTSVAMEKTTGYKILDDAALQAFSRWRFKPGTVSKIYMPITFKLGSPPSWID
jgi:protein TonB